MTKSKKIVQQSTTDTVSTTTATEVSETPKTATVPVAKTEADKIWDEIKNVRVNMYSLPGKRVSDFCAQAKIEPSRCFLKYGTASAIIPALEEVIGKKYTVELSSQYIIVSRPKTF